MQIKNNKKAIIFSRVSSENQEDGHSLDAQLISGREYCTKKDLIPIKEFRIVESSMKARPQFYEMIDFIKKQKDKISIVSFCVDRLHRDFDSMSVINNLRKDGKVEVHFVKDGTMLDKNSDSSMLFRYGLDVLLGNDSSNRTGERVKTAFAKKLNEGTILGPAPLGYLNQARVDKKKEKAVVFIDETKAEHIRNMFEWYSTGGYSMEDIRQKVMKAGLTPKSGKELAKSQVENIMVNPFYCGFIKRKNGDLHSHIYPRLITKELFDICQDVKNGKKRTKHRRTQIDFTLAGMVTCKHCNRLYSGELKFKPTKKYGLREYVYMRPNKRNNPCVYCANTKEEVIFEQIEEAIKRIAIPEEVFNAIRSRLKTMVQTQAKAQTMELNTLKESLNAINTRLENIRYKYIDGKITDEEHTLWTSEERQKKIALEGKIASLRIVDDNFDEQVTKMFIRASKAHETWKSSGTEEKRRIISLLFPNLFLDGQNLGYTLRKPFDVLCNFEERPIWLPDYSTLRIKENKIDTIKYTTPFFKKLSNDCREDTIKCGFIIKNFRSVLMAA